MDRTLIGERLREARGSRSSAEIAKKIGISRSAIQMYEAGERIPRDEIKRKLAEEYSTTVQALFFN